MKDELPYSLEVEKFCLATMLQHPECIVDFLPVIKAGAFYAEIHDVIFGAIKAQFAKDAALEKVLLIQQIENLGIVYKDNIRIGEYISALYSLVGVNVASAEKYFKELNKYHIARKITQKCGNLIKDIGASLNLSAKDLIVKAETGISDCITSHVEEDFNPIDLYAVAEDIIESIGEGDEEDGIGIPFKTMSKMWGNLLSGDLTVIAAPAGQGKSTILNILARYAVESEKAYVLFLDTEMETARVIRRNLAAESGVPEYYLRTGKWRRNEEMVKKVRAIWPKYKTREGFDHLYVANKPIDEIVSVIRRWAAKCKSKNPDAKLLIVYDYLKLTGERPSESWKEYQIMGQKADTIKRLCSEVGASGLAAVQTNAQGDIAMAQQIKWFASNVYVLQPKTPDEVNLHGVEFGTHTLKAKKTRNQGEEAQGFNSFVRIVTQDGSSRYEENFINLKFDNFDVTECGTYNDIVSRRAGGADLVEELAEGGRDYQLL